LLRDSLDRDMWYHTLLLSNLSLWRQDQRASYRNAQSSSSFMVVQGELLSWLLSVDTVLSPRTLCIPIATCLSNCVKFESTLFGRAKDPLKYAYTDTGFISSIVLRTPMRTEHISTSRQIVLSSDQPLKPQSVANSSIQQTRLSVLSNCVINHFPRPIQTSLVYLGIWV